MEAGLLERVDYADAFRVDCEVGDLEQLTAFSRAVLGVPPGWVRALLRLRNLIVSPLGLRTSVEPTPERPGALPKAGDRVGLFTVKAVEVDQLVLGEDDRHLDFRVSVLRQEERESTGVVVTTLVCFHNLLGRAYFVAVGPFHRVIVPAMIRRGIDVLESSREPLG
jgi:hypothetical protein